MACTSARIAGIDRVSAHALDQDRSRPGWNAVDRHEALPVAVEHPAPVGNQARGAPPSVTSTYFPVSNEWLTTPGSEVVAVRNAPTIRFPCGDRLGCNASPRENVSFVKRNGTGAGAERWARDGPARNHRPSSP
jgi:hypothetical protein